MSSSGIGIACMIPVSLCIGIILQAQQGTVFGKDTSQIATFLVLLSAIQPISSK